MPNIPSPALTDELQAFHLASQTLSLKPWTLKNKPQTPSPKPWARFDNRLRIKRLLHFKKKSLGHWTCIRAEKGLCFLKNPRPSGDCIRHKAQTCARAVALEVDMAEVNQAPTVRFNVCMSIYIYICIYVYTCMYVGM